MDHFRTLFHKLSHIIVACTAVLLFTNAAFAACTSDQIDVLGDGTQCETNKFSVTTTSDATIVPGKVFRGWKFEKPSGN